MLIGNERKQSTKVYSVVVSHRREPTNSVSTTVLLLFVLLVILSYQIKSNQIQSRSCEAKCVCLWLSKQASALWLCENKGILVDSGGLG
jgi:hypothetical protein